MKGYSAVAPSPGIVMEDTTDTLYKKITWRIIPLLFICYVVAYLDRVNVGFAKLQMLSDLRFSDAVYGLGAGVFFIGYFLAEVPSNLILHKVGARRWIARIMFTWGLLSATTAFVRTPEMFYLVRFLLGIAEAGFFPGIVLYLTYWYPAHRRGKMVAVLMAGNPVSGIVGGAVSGYIMHSLAGYHGFAGWQWLFLIEALPAIVLGAVVYFYLSDGISTAAWLSETEKSVLGKEIGEESQGKTHTSLASAFNSGRIWLLCGILFLIVMGSSTIGFWLPSIIKNSGVSDPLYVGLLASIPYIAALIAMLFTGRSADRMRERRWHVVVPLLVACGGFLICAQWSASSIITIIGLTIATMGIITSLPMFWALPTSFLGGTAAAAGIALINSTGNLASFVGPSLLGLIKSETHSLGSGLLLVSVCLVIASLLIITFVPAKMVNR